MIAAEPAWNRARWIRVIAILFAVHLFLAWALAQRVVPNPRKAPETAPVVLLTSLEANRALANYPEVAGSTLFALVDSRGVSGEAWLRSEPRANMLAEWQEPEFSLLPNPERLGLAFQKFILTNAPQLTRAGELPTLPPPNIALEPNLPVTTSRYFVKGALAKRQLLADLTVPAWSFGGTLRDTEVRVAVDASGEIFSAVQDAASSLSAELKTVDPAQQLIQQQADKKAVELVQQLRFSPAPTRKPASPAGSDLVWGTVVFRWATTPPATNSLPAPP